jgi:hypothetical protein
MKERCRHYFFRVGSLDGWDFTSEILNLKWSQVQFITLQGLDNGGNESLSVRTQMAYESKSCGKFRQKLSCSLERGHGGGLCAFGAG